MAVHPSISGASFYKNHILLAKTPFDQNIENTEIIESRSVSTALFQVSINSEVVDVVSVYANRGIILEVAEPIPTSASVEITYVDPAGDQTEGVPQDLDGEDLASFVVTALPYFGYETQVLDGALFGVKPGISDEDWFYGNTYGSYVPAVAGAGGQPDSLIEVVGQTASTFTLEFKPDVFFTNPSYTVGGSGFTAFEFVNETFQGEFLRDTHDLSVGQKITLMDLLDRETAFRAVTLKMGVAVSIDGQNYDDTFYISEQTSRGPGDVMWMSLDSFLYESQGVYFDEAVIGASLDDVIETSGGDDKISGATGNDTLYARAGNDVVDGGSGNDLLIGGSGLGNDTYIGGAGTDTVSYTSATAGIQVDLLKGTATSLSGNAASIGQDQLSGIENIVGGQYDDILIGDTQANRLFGGSGSDQLDGGAGVDTAAYLGSRLTMSRSGDQWQVAGDTLVNIERVEFDNGAIGLDAISQRAYRIYKAAFDRSPDEEGLGYWIQELDKGFALHQVTNSFVISQEFKNLYGADLDNAGFITALYHNVLDRDPDQEGLNYWINDMENSGMSRADVLASFSESAENIANTDPLIALGVMYQPYGESLAG